MALFIVRGRDATASTNLISELHTYGTLSLSNRIHDNNAAEYLTSSMSLLGLFLPLIPEPPSMTPADPALAKLSWELDRICFLQLTPFSRQCTVLHT